MIFFYYVINVVIFSGFVLIGQISNQLFSYDKKKDEEEMYIPYALLILFFIIFLLLSIKIFNISIIYYFLITAGVIFFCKKLLNFKNNNSNIKYIILLFTVIFLICFKDLRVNGDIDAYFFTINQILENSEAIYDINLNQRILVNSPFYLFLNSVIIKSSDLYSYNFIDKIFGIFILFFIIKNIKKINFLEKIFLFLISLSISYHFTSTVTADFIITSILLIKLIELKKDLKEINLFKISGLILVLYGLHFLTLISFSIFYILLLFLFNFKIFINKNKSLYKALFITPIFLIPFLLYYNLNFGTWLPPIIESKYFFSKNIFFQNYEIIFVYDSGVLLNFLSSRFNLIAVILSIFYFFLSQEKKSKKIMLISSFYLFNISLSLITFPDKINYLRYLHPFLAAYVIFIFIEIFISLKNINYNLFYKILLIVLLCILSLRANSNFLASIINSTININEIINLADNKKIIKILTKKGNFYYKNNHLLDREDPIKKVNYSKEINLLLKQNHINNNLVLLIGRPHLVNLADCKSCYFSEYKIGFFTKNNYPIFQDFSLFKEFLKTEKFKYLIVEKKLLEQYKQLNSKISESKIEIKNNLQLKYVVYQRLFFDDFYKNIKYMLDDDYKFFESENFIILKI